MNTKTTQTNTYEIKLQEALSSSWQSFFDKLELRSETQEGNCRTILTGELDQSALHGVLNQIRDLNLHLISVCIITQSVPQTVTPQKGISL